jgi:hypothetical protein
LLQLKAKIIAYDVSLDKDDNAESLIVTSGGHEIGHIVNKHDELVQRAKKHVRLSLPSGFKEKHGSPELGSYLVCRRCEGSKPRLEFMCDEFMGCFLMPREMVSAFVKDHWLWCFDETGSGWTGMAQIMARNFKVNPLTASVRLARLNYIHDIAEAGCRVRSIEGWKQMQEKAG